MCNTYISSSLEAEISCPRQIIGNASCCRHIGSLARRLSLGRGSTRPAKPRRSHMFRSIALSVAAIAAFAAVAGAQPTVRTDIPVRYSDLNLNSETDARILLDRIKRAAVMACGGEPGFHL